MKRITVLLFLFMVLASAGCSTASQMSSGIETESTVENIESSLSDSLPRYKEMTGSVVVFGTSIWAIEPGPGGVASNLEDLTSFQVKDYSLLGGLATRVEGDSFSDISLVSILLYNKDKTSEEMRDAIPAADYVILAFGGNDHSMGIPASGEGDSFENALLISISAIRRMNPDVRIILVSPTDSWAYEDGRYVFSTQTDNGGGKIGDYVEVIKRVAEKEDILWVNMLDAWTFCEDDPTRYSEDGSHLSELGRRIYAEYLAEHIYDYYYSGK